MDIDFLKAVADKESNIAFDRAKHTELNAHEQGKRKQRLYHRDGKQADASVVDTEAEQSVDGSKNAKRENSEDTKASTVCFIIYYEYFSVLCYPICSA